jgi:carboxymethylenebutenolidase
MPITSSQVLTSADGHTLSAFQAEPDAASLKGFATEAGPRARGGVVIVQEIFGVNAHIRAVCEQFAAHGYFAIAPALFDRLRPTSSWITARTAWRWGARCAPGSAGRGRCATWRRRWGWPPAMAGSESSAIAGAVCYYGGQIAQFKDERPNCPVLMHFGARDPMIPPADIDAVRQAQAGAEVEIHVYPEADHGFNCTERSSFHAPSARLALDRTLAFLEAHLKMPAF